MWEQCFSNAHRQHAEVFILIHVSGRKKSSLCQLQLRCIEIVRSGSYQPTIHIVVTEAKTDLHFPNGNGDFNLWDCVNQQVKVFTE